MREKGAAAVRAQVSSNGGDLTSLRRSEMISLRALENYENDAQKSNEVRATKTALAKDILDKPMEEWTEEEHQLVNWYNHLLEQLKQYQEAFENGESLLVVLLSYI